MLLELATFDLKTTDSNWSPQHRISVSGDSATLSLYLAGRVRPSDKLGPRWSHAAIVGVDGFRAEAEPLPAVRWDEEPAVQILSAQGEALIGSEMHRGGKCFAMVAVFGLREQPEWPEGAQNHYLSYHINLARRMPGLVGYYIGALLPSTRDANQASRLAVLIFPRYESMRAAYRSPVGRELAEDERRLIAEPQVLFIDAHSAV